MSRTEFLAVLSLVNILVMASCGKKSGEGQSSNPITEPAPEFARIPTGVSSIELPKQNSFSFPIRMAKLGSDTKFQFSCEPKCPIGFSVSKEGLVTWVPPATVEEVPYFRVVVRAKDSHSPESSAAFEFSIGDSNYQIGKTWDRIPASSSLELKGGKFLKDVIGGEMSDGFAGGTVEYLGSFEGKHLILSAAHVFDSVRVHDKTQCDKDRIFFFPESNMAFSCVENIFTSENSDFAIYQVLPILNEKFSAPVLTSSFPKFSARIEAPGQALGVGGFGKYRNVYRDLLFDQSSTCMTYSTEEREVENSNAREVRENPKKALIYGILVAPCEASDGDSGGPVYLQNSSEIVGIVRGGSNFQVSDEEALQGLNVTEEERLKFAKLQYVSSLAIYREVSEFVRTSNANTDALKSWVGRQFNK